MNDRNLNEHNPGDWNPGFVIALIFLTLAVIVYVILVTTGTLDISDPTGPIPGPGR